MISLAVKAVNNISPFVHQSVIEKPRWVLNGLLLLRKSYSGKQNCVLASAYITNL